MNETPMHLSKVQMRLTPVSATVGMMYEKPFGFGRIIDSDDFDNYSLDGFIADTKESLGIIETSTLFAMFTLTVKGI